MKPLNLCDKCYEEFDPNLLKIYGHYCSKKCFDSAEKEMKDIRFKVDVWLNDIRISSKE